MKIAISSNDGKMDSKFSTRFGRCEYFLFINTDTGEWEAVSNPAISTQGGAGTQVVQFLTEHGVEATITGRYGPNAFTALKIAGIKAYEAGSGTPRELLEKLKAGELILANASSGSRKRR